MDRYMNDTHSLYYNVDHSSMFGSNLSTVFADGPPPLEDGDDDHGEFVFSSQTDAIGEAMLSKIESKLQLDAEGKLVGEKSGLQSDQVETSANSEKFEAFASFETAKHISTSEGQEASIDSPKEVNGLHGENMKNRALPEDDFSDDEFGDFSSGFGTNSNFSQTDNVVKGHDSNFGNFSAFNNKGGLNNGLTSNEKISFNGDDRNNSETGSESNDFADFSSFDSAELKTSEDIKSGQNSSDQFPMHCNGSKIQNDDKFGSLEDANKGDFSNSKSDAVETSSTNKGHFSQDIILTAGTNKLASINLPSVLTDGETNNDESNSFQSFTEDTPSVEKDDTGISKVKYDLTDKMNNEDSTLMTCKDDSFNDFTSANNEFGRFSQSIPSTEDEANEFASFKSESEPVELKLYNSATDLGIQTDEKAKTISRDDDFGDFADFSQNSFGAFSSDSDLTSEKQSDSTFGTFSTNESRAINEEDSNVEKFANNAGIKTSVDTKVFSGQKSENAFSESSSSSTKTEFDADFGAFSEDTSINNKKELQDEFGAFSEGTSSKNKQGFQAEFGAFSQNISQKSFNQTVSAKQHGSIQTQLISLHACFQDVFVTLQHKVQDLLHMSTPGDKSRRKQENLQKHLHYTMGEAELRFNWKECETSDKMCSALDVSRKDATVNPNILAMSEGLEIPVFATGLGFLQPSIAPAPPKKKKTKTKGMKDPKSSTKSLESPTLSPSLSQQTLTQIKTESTKENASDTASLSNSDTSSLDLDFFASAPSNLPVNPDPSSSSSFYNLDFAFAHQTPPANQGAFASDPLKSSSNDFDVPKTSKSVQDDPLEILKKLDTSKMSSAIMNGSQARLSEKAKEIIEEFDDLSFMHSSVLMFPLNKSN